MEYKQTLNMNKSGFPMPREPPFRCKAVTGEAANITPEHPAETAYPD